MGPAAVAVAAISAVAAVAGGVVSFISHQQAARAARAQAEAQARAAEENARQARIAAQYEIYKRRYQLSQLLGKQMALFGKAGVLMEGTPLEVFSESLRQGEMDIKAQKYAGEVTSQRWLTEAQATRTAGATTAGLYATQSYQSLLGTLPAAGSLLMQGWSLYRGK